MRLVPHLDDELIFCLESFGQWVRRLRSRAGLGQSVLGERCGCSQSTISRLENGLVPNMPLSRAVRILMALDAFPHSRSLGAQRATGPLSDAQAEELLRQLIG